MEPQKIARLRELEAKEWDAPAPLALPALVVLTEEDKAADPDRAAEIEKQNAAEIERTRALNAPRAAELQAFGESIRERERLKKEALKAQTETKTETDENGYPSVITTETPAGTLEQRFTFNARGELVDFTSNWI